MDDQEWFAEQMAQHRPRLRAVAYRLLGSLTEVDDALQEAWLRTTRADPALITNPAAWLTTLVGRVCIDMLRARQARREQLSATWEPLVSEYGDPEEATLHTDAVGIALLVVLDSLEPAERLAVVLHDMFGMPFEQVAVVVGRTPAATRQLASRARRRLREHAPQPRAGLPAQRRVVDAFLAAARAGDFDALLALLAPDVVFRSDHGRRARLAPALLTGARAVAARAADAGPRFARLCAPAMVNGVAGVVARDRSGKLVAVVGFTVHDDRIAAIDMVLDPDKLPAGPAASTLTGSFLAPGADDQDGG
ncbi:sigma-70 family RNA polymerase sigma factor [Micromonospora parathelypteridis]|uniref:RNA polymerase sigma-70 factor (ECF subfamily) n=1 Tax=Micromonospora parathelypteridis TaxID=1839617 RepID=A0A840VUP4_9ACTN|nr:sigma-70 family RNA polymerase sigma factor [Micromonospora parathelypteridis]MBB5480337.1 RNA polymerase sigma-70 factor (ECF subfamily) [Micromonospora parathelypteridis]GGO23872.1 DNA-directed RNA polymerase sigma-70 factor [Micromonospora parathelypteridis]